jgi:hypothetical protein
MNEEPMALEYGAIVFPGLEKASQEYIQMDHALLSYWRHSATQPGIICVCICVFLQIDLRHQLLLLYLYMGRSANVKLVD